MEAHTNAAAWSLAALALVLFASCTPGGGSGMGGTPDEEDAGAGCEPAAGQYTGAWSMPVDGSDEDCPAIEPSSSTFGDGADADCDTGCTCSRTVTQQDGVCVGMLFEECTDDDGFTTLLACAIGSTAGATEFGGRCGIEVTDDDGTVLIECRYDVEFRRTGD